MRRSVHWDPGLSQLSAISVTTIWGIAAIDDGPSWSLQQHMHPLHSIMRFIADGSLMSMDLSMRCISAVLQQGTPVGHTWQRRMGCALPVSADKLGRQR